MELIQKVKSLFKNSTPIEFQYLYKGQITTYRIDYDKIKSSIKHTDENNELLTIFLNHINDNPDEPFNLSILKITSVYRYDNGIKKPIFDLESQLYESDVLIDTPEKLVQVCKYIRDYNNEKRDKFNDVQLNGLENGDVKQHEIKNDNIDENVNLLKQMNGGFDYEYDEK